MILPDLLAQISNCSTAAALNVSAAATTTFLPCFTKLFAIFPIEVVFPTPFTPITKIIDELPENDRALIRLRFYEELTQSKTAQILGISQVQVSRREKIILSQMREKLIS